MSARRSGERRGTISSVLVVLRYARGYRGPISLAVFATTALVGIQLLVPWIVNKLVSGVGDSVTSSAPLTLVTALAAGLLALYAIIARNEDFAR